MTWFNEVENPKKQVVKKVVCKDKGLILETCTYSAFIFKSSKLYNQLMEALTVFASSGTGIELEIVPDQSDKFGFVVKPSSKGHMQEWFYNPTSATYSNELESLENPFLSMLTPPPNPLLSGSSLPTTTDTTVEQSSRNGRKATSLPV